MYDVSAKAWIKFEVNSWNVTGNKSAECVRFQRARENQEVTPEIVCLMEEW